MSRTDRGYTMHEHLEEMGAVHMNGRIYDPLIGRFMSADPFIQSPDNLQSYNRYAYVLNNPLAYTDPSGYFSLKKLFRFAVSIWIGSLTGNFMQGWMVNSAYASGGLSAVATTVTSMSYSVVPGMVGGFWSEVLLLGPWAVAR